ncbi:CWF19-like protein 2 isoform X2 [Zingiber officinale]|uniref:CWF19-like protein 2 isoform X2 n=1 Tax=Zingiber officinale TaxID=94328 RepID=UPI001C4B883D|nr:CWF19-like protein 2 isoform X2 [Zingiber officinale]
MFSGIKFIPKEKLLSEKSQSDSDESGDKKIKRIDIRKRRQESSDDYSSSSEDNERKGKIKRKQRKRSREVKKKRKEKRSEDVSNNDSDRDLFRQNNEEIVRKELGLDWMLRSTDKMIENIHAHEKEATEEHEAVEEQRTHPRELNPYLKENGSGYPDDSMISDISGKPSSSAVGDGGASWRLKALKRAKEQAAREGRKLDKVVEERWGSLGQLTASVAASRAAPSHAHLHAIRDRRKGPSEFPESVLSDRTTRSIQQIHGEYNDISSRNSEMRRPKHDNLSWKKRRSSNMSAEDKSLISSAISDLNKFANDGSFMERISQHQNKSADVSTNSADPSPRENDQVEKRLQSLKEEVYEEKSLQSQTPVLSANQLAAKVLQLRMKGKHEEAEKLVKEMEAMVEKADADTKAVRLETQGSKDRYVMKQTSRKHMRREDDADLHLAQTIMQNKKYSLGEEDEYGFDVAPSKKNNKRKKDVAEDRNFSKRLLTQQERCQFCFENPSRPKHLVVSIANFTYLMLPQRQPIVEGHCCILPMQHEAATRSVDINVGDEIRNFKKCLVKMFASQDKDVLFLETVVQLSKQRRHCLLECIPIPSERAEEAPMYFRKALEEAEEEWGQHEMKKVIPTKGNLRQVIPENFSYFHVEFGLDKGFVHVIDKDSNFESGFGLNVVRGLLRLPEEDMYRSRRHESTDKQQQAVARFARDWQRFDWTRELE